MNISLVGRAKELKMGSQKRFLLLGFALVIGAIGVGAGDNPSIGTTELDGEIEAIIKSAADREVQIILLGKLQRKFANQFSWKLHNELRHLYSFEQPAQALKQCDLLLAHSVMDDYILKILSGWELGKQPKKAIAKLLRSARSTHGCEHVQAACWLQVGDLYRELGALTSADLYYHKVLNQEGMISSPYQTLAEQRLGLMQ